MAKTSASRTLALSFAALATVLTLGKAARAEPAVTPLPRSTVITLRTEGIFGLRTEGIGVGGLSGALRLWDLFEVGGGAALWTNICSAPVVPVGRIGVSVSLDAPPAGRSGWDLRVPFLAEYSYFELRNSGCDMDRPERIHAFAVQTGLDATRWGEGPLGLSLRTLVFVGPSYVSTGEAYGPPTSPYKDSQTAGLLFSIGLVLSPD